jgi:hypothetical protein
MTHTTSYSPQPQQKTTFSVWIQLRTNTKNGATIRKAAVWAGMIMSPRDEDDEREMADQPLRHASGVPVYQEVSRASSLSRQSIYAPSLDTSYNKNNGRQIRTLSVIKASTHSSYKWPLAMIMDGMMCLEESIAVARLICTENRGPTKIIAYTIALAQVFPRYQLFIDPKAIFNYEPVHWFYIQKDGELAIETCNQKQDNNNKENTVCVH